MSKEKLKLFIESVVAEELAAEADLEGTIKDVLVQLFDSFIELDGIEDINEIENVIVNHLFSLPQFRDGLQAAAEELVKNLNEAKYHGRTVTLNKRMKGDVKKSKVYVKDPKTGNIKKVNFGDPNMRIKKSNPKRRKSFRARHNCENPGPKTKARYWSCKAWWFMKKISEKILNLHHPKSGYKKTIKVKKYKAPDGNLITSYVDAGMQDSVQVFALTENNNVIIVKQYRPGSEKEEIELPGGRIDEGESKEKAAHRELKEETGYTTDKLFYLGSKTYSPYSEWRIYFFAALNCSKTDNLKLDRDEYLSAHEMPLKAYRELMKKSNTRGVDCAYMALDNLDMLWCKTN